MSNVSMKEYPYALRHGDSKHTKGCGKAAYYLKCKPESESVISSKDFINIDGTHIEEGDLFCCGSCGGFRIVFDTPLIFNRSEDE